MIGSPIWFLLIPSLLNARAEDPRLPPYFRGLKTCGYRPIFAGLKTRGYHSIFAG